jgi:hypothetical protein
MSPIQLPLPAAPCHRSQQLFSDYYLDTLLPQRGDWQMPVAAAERVRERIIYRDTVALNANKARCSTRRAWRQAGRPWARPSIGIGRWM